MELEACLVKMEGLVLMNISSTADDKWSRGKWLEVLFALWYWPCRPDGQSLLKQTSVCMQSQDGALLCSVCVLLVQTVPQLCIFAGCSVEDDSTPVERQDKQRLSIEPGKCSFPH